MNFLEISKQNIIEYKRVLNERESKDDVKQKSKERKEVDDEKLEDSISGDSKEGKKIIKNILDSDVSDFEIESIDASNEINDDRGKPKVGNINCDEESDEESDKSFVNTNVEIQDSKKAYGSPKKSKASGATATAAQECLQTLVICDSLKNGTGTLFAKEDGFIVVEDNAKMQLKAIEESFFEKGSSEGISFSSFIENLNGTLTFNDWGDAALSLYNLKTTGAESNHYLNLLKKGNFKVVYPHKKGEKQGSLEAILYGDGVSSKDSYIPADVYFVSSELLKKENLDNELKQIFTPHDTKKEAPTNENTILNNKWRKSHVQDVVDLINIWFSKDKVIPISLKKVQVTVNKVDKNAELHYVKNSDLTNKSKRDEVLNSELIVVSHIDVPQLKVVNLDYKKSNDFLEIIRKLKNQEDRQNFKDALKADSTLDSFFSKLNDETWESEINNLKESENKPLSSIGQALVTKTRKMLGDLDKQYLTGNTYIYIDIPNPKSKKLENSPDPENKIFHHFDKFSHNDVVTLQLEFRAKDNQTYCNKNGDNYSLQIKANEWQCNAMIQNAKEAILGGGLKDQLKNALAKCSFITKDLNKRNSFDKDSYAKLLSYQASAIDISKLNTKMIPNIEEVKLLIELYKGTDKTNQNFKTSAYAGVTGALAFLYILSKIADDVQQVFFRDVILKSYKLDFEVQDTLKIY